MQFSIIKYKMKRFDTHHVTCDLSGKSSSINSSFDIKDWDPSRPFNPRLHKHEQELVICILAYTFYSVKENGGTKIVETICGF